MFSLLGKELLKGSPPVLKGGAFPFDIMAEIRPAAKADDSVILRRENACFKQQLKTLFHKSQKMTTRFDADAIIVFRRGKQVYVFTSTDIDEMWPLTARDLVTLPLSPVSAELTCGRSI